MSHGVILGPDNQRMSKSKGNVIVPETVADKYGVDVVRMYLMFMGPFNGTMAWNEKTLMGVKRFLDRFEKLCDGYNGGVSQDFDLFASDRDSLLTIINKTVDGVTRDLEEFGYNTAIAKIMGLLNDLEKRVVELCNLDMEVVIKLIAPFAPYMAEEQWFKLNRVMKGVVLDKYLSVHMESWPVADPKYLIEESVMVMLAINGKVRGLLEISREELTQEKTILIRAKQSDKIKPWLEGKQIVKEIYVPGKMINLVVK
jgi:leucyl-tRNA synthetase